MASQYALQLKASLDTTQVQQELKRLRAAQAQAAQEMGGVKGTPVGSAHMQKIEVQLTKLNTTISGLQHAIEQLSRAQVHTAQQANIPQHASGLPYLPPGMSRTQFNSWMGSKEYGRLNQRVYDLVRSKGLVSGGYATVDGMRFAMADPALAHRLWGTGLLKQFDPSFSKSAYLGQMTNWNQLNAQPANFAKQRALFRQGRQFAGLIGGQLLGGAGDIASAMGYTTLGNYLGNIGAGVTSGAGAGMGMSLAGLGGKAAGGIGIAVGLATVITKNISSMEQLAQAVNKTAKAFDENYNSLHRQTRSIQESILGSRHQTRANQLLESGNIEEAKKQAKYWSDAYEYAKTTFESINDPQDEENRIRKLAERKKAAVDDALNGTNLAWAESTLGETLFKIMGQPGAETRKGEVKNQIDEEAQRQIQEMHQRYKDLEADMNKARGFADTYQSVFDKFEKDRNADFEKSKAEVEKRLALSERNDQAIARYEAQSSANRTQVLANDILGDKMLSPLEKFTKISEELDNLRATRNTALEGAFGLSRDINAGKMTPEEMARAMAKQSKYEFQASSAANLIGILENALANIATETIAPDLSHVTSLAQYGFNMGEKDDATQRMDKYYTKSINLQQQIKDKIEQGIKTEAIYN